MSVAVFCHTTGSSGVERNRPNNMVPCFCGGYFRSVYVILEDAFNVAHWPAETLRHDEPDCTFWLEDIGDLAAIATHPVWSQ